MLRPMGADGTHGSGATVPHVNHLAVPVDDVAQATAFYEELFAARVVPSPAFSVPVSWVMLGNLQLHLVQRAGHATSAYHFALSIESREHFEALYHRGGRDGLFERELLDHHLYEAPGGVVQLYLRDPSGNVVECDYPDVRDLDTTIVADIRRWADLNEQSAWNNQASVLGTVATAVEDR
jgi:catechol 2,3-dioxygenase-like lactoylglutathione lyase family enzyme